MAQHIELYLLAFLSGIIWFSLSTFLGVLVLISGFVWYFLMMPAAKRGRMYAYRLHAWCVMVCICCMFFAAGYIRIFYAERGRSEFSQILRGVTGQVTLSGVLDGDPIVREQGSVVTMEVETLMVGEVSLARSGMVRLELPRYPEYWRGQLLVVVGRVEWSEVMRMWTMRRGQVHSVEHPGGLSGMVLSVRQRLIERMGQLFPGSAGGFLLGILAGGGRGVSRDVLDDVRATGLTHVIAVSGYNVTLVLGLVMGVFAWVPRKWKVLPIAGALLIFVLLVGMSASAVRAALMGFLMVYALSAGRKRELLLALLWSAIAMVLWRPFMLMEDRGFQLSFLATIGVCYLAPEILERVNHSRFVVRMVERWGLWLKTLLFEPFFTTFAVYLVTVPVLFSFQQFSLIGLVTNVIFVPFIPMFMLLAVVGLIVSIVFWPLGFFVGRLGALVVDWYFLALHGFAVLSFSNIEVPPMSNWVVILYFNMLVWLYTKMRAASLAMPRSGNRQSHLSP